MAQNKDTYQKNVEAWDRHYKRKRARQLWPDENLVRMLSAIPERGPALDLGCGSGRHLRLLLEMGFSPVCGADSSREAIALCQRDFPAARLAFLEPKQDATFPELLSIFFGDKNAKPFSAIVAWGVLHYNAPELQRSLLSVIKKALSPQGYFLGTLRADTDTHFQGNPDINEAPIYFFSETEARSLLESRFKDVRLGYIERRPPGELARRICHWTFVCQNGRPVHKG